MKQLLSFFLSVILLLSITGCDNNSNSSSGTEPSADPENPNILSVNWSMTAYLVGPDGSVQKSFPMTVQGKIEQGETVSYLRVEITTPEDFSYSFVIPDPNGYISQKEDFFRDGDYRMGGFCYNKEDNDGAGFDGMINTEKEYLIIYWNEDPGYFLVAATDANATNADISNYFADFTQWITPFLQK